MGGFADFLYNIYVLKDMEERQAYWQWVKSLGWSNRKIDPSKMI